MKKINPDLLSIIKIIYWLGLIFIILALFGLGFFAYYNVYQSLNTAQELTNLKQEILETRLNWSDFQMVVERYENKKKSNIILDNNTSSPPFKNPF